VSRRVAIVLWIAAAVVVWNAVFDRVLVLAGREYVKTAKAAADGSGPYARIDDSMRPALSRALAFATLAAGAVAAAGVLDDRRRSRATSAGSPRRT